MSVYQESKRNKKYKYGNQSKSLKLTGDIFYLQIKEISPGALSSNYSTSKDLIFEFVREESEFA